MLYLALGIFLIVMIVIIFEWVDKAVASLIGAVLFIILGIVNHHQAIESIDFETILLLMGMMMLIDIAKRTQVFAWLNVKIARLTNGSPILILLFFLSITALFSAFLDNVTTVLLIVPITIALTSGIGLDPTGYVIAEALFSNIGGAVTMIGDPPNILIGSASGLSFAQFIANLVVPVVVSMVLALIFIISVYWTSLKPIRKDLEKLFVSHLLIKKITYKFLDKKLNKSFVIKTLGIFLFVLIAFFAHSALDLSVDIISVFAALILLLITKKQVSASSILREVEWGTLFFFAGLFIMVGGLKAVGFLDIISSGIISLTDDFTMLLLIILWASALISMIFDNIPFVAVMIPVILNVQASFPGNPNLDLLWWSLSLGACLGGNGTLIGASANVVAIDTAKKYGVNISFMDFFKKGFPVMIISMIVSSVYLLFRVGYFN